MPSITFVEALMWRQQTEADVFENFQYTPAVPDALAVMVEAYQLLNMDDLAQESYRTFR